ncbi:MAG: PEP-CTERM sorting domain-containing protein [Myxococcota bacterium]
MPRIFRFAFPWALAGALLALPAAATPVRVQWSTSDALIDAASGQALGAWTSFDVDVDLAAAGEQAYAIPSPTLQVGTSPTGPHIDYVTASADALFLLYDAATGAGRIGVDPNAGPNASILFEAFDRGPSDPGSSVETDCTYWTGPPVASCVALTLLLGNADPRVFWFEDGGVFAFPIPGKHSPQSVSVEVIPEPGTAALVGLGLLAFGWRRARHPAR